MPYHNPDTQRAGAQGESERGRPVLDDDQISVRPLYLGGQIVPVIQIQFAHSEPLLVHPRAALKMAGAILQTVAPLVYARLYSQQEREERC